MRNIKKINYEDLSKSNELFFKEYLSGFEELIKSC